MKPDFPPPPPGDEAADPLLAALRQRLGDYGQAPPLGAWAAIRRQVAPAALPPPWWRRRPPLVLLGLLLLLYCLLPGKLSEYATRYRAGQAAGARRPQLAAHTTGSPTLAAVATEQAGQLEDSAAAGASASTLHSPTTSRASALEKAKQATSALAQASATKQSAAIKTLNAPHLATTAASPARLLRSRRAGSSDDTAAGSTSTPAASFTAAASQRKTRHLVLASAAARRRATGHGATGRHPHATEPTAASYPAKTYASARRTGHPATPGRVPTRTVARADYAHHNAAKAAAQVATEHDSVAPRSHAAYPAGTFPLAARRPSKNRRRARRAELAARPAATDALAVAVPTATTAWPTTAVASTSSSFGPVDILASKQANSLFSMPAGPAALVAWPDSILPLPPPPVRRWALLVLAGPTLSYRTLGPAPALAAGHPDFARLERPALGLGAQVQVRRVLSGRWALAAGLGYHEYATRLALSIKDSSRYTAFYQRDTYRLLTMPVQLSYALGAPKGHLTKALLLGLEPGWYAGGRSTEGSGCGCEQQAYSSAGGSPYRSLTVAFSLGLDVRLRLGGAASRWQWLVQPTGRYVATPFVRADAVGFTRRQPLSLGLLTGFSWDVR